ncbi:MAG: hypothetical protein JW951_07415 [Lentisphaerae bacterium]|nr:hypothetical protein [Lentisphaerota bacterium]
MTLNMMRTGWIVVLITSLGLFLPAEAAVTNVSLSDSQRVWDNYPQDGDGDDATLAWSFAGDYKSSQTGGGANRMFRMSYVFPLPHAGDLGYSVNDATFSMVIKSVADNGNLPDLDIVLLNKGTVGDAAPGDYEAVPVATLSSIATPATANGTTVTWSHADLLDALNAAYSNGTEYVAFRPQLALTGDFYDSVNG